MRKILIIFCLFLASLNVQAQDYQKVYLNEALDVALKNNIDLEASKINIDVAKNQLKQANRLQNPSLDYYHFMGNAANSEPKQIGITQNIELAKRGSRKNLAKSELKLAEKTLDYTTFDLKMDVREAYVELVAAKSILNTLEQQLELQEELLAIAQNRVKENNAPMIDVIQAEIALNQLITQINTARMVVKRALAYFNKVINTSTDTVYDSMDKLFAEENNFEEMMTPPPTRKFPGVEYIVKEALKNRFDIAIAKQQVEIAQKNLKVVASQRVPDLQVAGGYAYLFGRNSNSGAFEHGAYAGASLVNLPLLYSYAPEIKTASLKIKQAELNLESTQNKAVKDVTASYEKFLTAVENLNHYESKIVTGSASLIDISKNSYEKGEIDIVSLIVMKQSYKSIIIGYTQALAEYYNSWTNVLREVNNENFVLSKEAL